MIRIPPRSASYEEKHEEQLKQADLLEQMAEKLKQVSPQGGEVLKNRAQGLRAGIGGGVEK
jgi:pheromone shutdown protein TraB